MDKKNAKLDELLAKLNDLQWEVKCQINAKVDPAVIYADVQRHLKQLSAMIDVEAVKLDTVPARLTGMDESQFQSCIAVKVAMFMTVHRVSREVLDEKRRTVNTIRAQCPDIDDVEWDENIARQTIRAFTRSRFLKYIKLQDGVYYRKPESIGEDHVDDISDAVLTAEPKTRRVLVRAMECIYQELQKHTQ